MDMRDWCRSPLKPIDQKRRTSIILDPPREGISEQFHSLLKKIEPLHIESLILVGCDVDAFTRDTRNFIQSGFQLKRLAVLDLFPQTPHAESLALFSK
jgi:23S rRNA (uracil1939-C5)-methyltransferase